MALRFAAGFCSSCHIVRGKAGAATQYDKARAVLKPAVEKAIEETKKQDASSK